jgi:hypothetical protein
MKNPFKRKPAPKLPGVFVAGDTVRVKEGVRYPDVPDVDIGGWQGRITDIDQINDDPPLVGLAWDSLALRSLPAWLIEASAEEGLGWSEIYLEVAELDHAPARDSEEDAEETLGELESLYRYSFLGEEGRRINAVLRGVDSNDTMRQFEAWAHHLQQTLKFPFDAEVVEFQERGRLRTGDILQVLRIELVDDSYGVIVHCRRRREEIDAPLADLECTNRQSANYELVKDYAVWFANR